VSECKCVSVGGWVGVNVCSCVWRGGGGGRRRPRPGVPVHICARGCLLACLSPRSHAGPMHPPVSREQARSAHSPSFHVRYLYSWTSWPQFWSKIMRPLCRCVVCVHMQGGACTLMRGGEGRGLRAERGARDKEGERLERACALLTWLPTPSLDLH
jgi:hypothetical protein